MAKLSDFHGAVSKCFCTNSDPNQPMDCKACFCRGWVAACLACNGSGQTRVPVAGTNTGDMASTCSKCGGTGTFPANAPAVAPATLHIPESTHEEEALQTA